MTEQNTPLLSPNAESNIQSRTFGMIQEEIGVLTTNLFMERAKCEAFQIQRAEDIKIIQALHMRISAMQSDMLALQAQIDAFEAPIASKSRKRKKA